MTVSFELDGQGFVALNGGTRSEFTESISFMVNCNTNKRWMSTGKNYPQEGTRDTVRLAERQIRSVMASYANCVDGNDW